MVLSKEYNRSIKIASILIILKKKKIIYFGIG